MTTTQQFIDAALHSDTTECIEWPFAVNPKGYGRVNRDGRNQYAHVLVLTMHTGSRPQDGQARHACDNPPCINPAHLSWGTAKQNVRDKLRAGTYGRTVTPSLAAWIKRTYASGQMTQREIAALTGLSRQHVGNITTGHRWGWVR